MIVAKTSGGVLAEGQKIPMYKEGNYYYGELYFDNPGTYVYSIQIDTGHGKLSSYEQKIVVSEKQKIVADEDEKNMLSGIGIFPIILILIFVSFRTKIRSF